MKEIVYSIRDIVDDTNYLAKSIEKITNNIKDITEKINYIMKRFDENDNINQNKMIE
jgi:prefoldin subunit 5